MQHRHQAKIEITIAVVLIACVAIAALLNVAVGQTPDHPAYGNHQVIQLTVTADVPDIPKAETKAVEILRKWDPSLTLAAARAKVRVDGRTDVARCLEYIYINHLDAITQADVTGIRQEVAHPEPRQ